jgi:hypothetical protein
MKHFSLSIFVLIFSIPVIGQRGYYSLDSVTLVGKELIDFGPSNSYYCSVSIDDKVLKYTPYEVSEYGFYQGKTYRAFDVVTEENEKRYFFELIVKGNINLYKLRLKGEVTKYYIQVGDSSNLHEVILKKEETQALISKYVGNCFEASQNIKYLKPNKYSLSRFLSYFNSCSNYPYPKIQYGFKVGIAKTQFYPIDKSSIYAIPDYNSDISFTISSFIGIPILSSNLSLTPEIRYKGNQYATSLINDDKSFNLILNYSTLNFPVLFKYSFLRNGSIPFIILGPVYSRVIKDKATLYEYEIVDDEVFIEINDAPVIQKNMGGFSLGFGLILDSQKRHKWSGEFQYNYLFNLNSSSKNFNLSEFSINAGILF